MKIRALAAFVCLALVAMEVPGRSVQRGAEEPRLVVRVQASDVARTTAGLQQAGYDILRVDAASSSIDLVVTRAQSQVLEAGGYRFAVIDRTRPLRDVRGALGTSPRSSPGGEVSITDAARASSTYLDLEEVHARMQQIASSYPSIARLVDITATYGTPPTGEGRHLFALKISDNVAVDEDEPGMLIVSAHHAREISTPLITLGAAERLTSGYASDPRIVSAVDTHEIWIAPVWNPDGYAYVFGTDNMWRKNRRPFTNGTGVDQNRNYSQGWTASCAGSTSTASETYKGPSAASEPETQTMMTWSRAERFAKVIDYHSYGREVLYGYLCLPHPFASWMQQEAAAISRASGYNGATREPSAEGEHPQWQMAAMGAYAFLIETHTEFQPSFASATSEAALVWPGILTVLERPVPITGHVTDAATGAAVTATVELVGVTFANAETNSSGGLFGAYHVFAPPGSYSVRFSAPGFTSEVRQVTVGASSSIQLDVALAKRPPAAPTNVRIVGISE